MIAKQLLEDKLSIENEAPEIDYIKEFFSELGAEKINYKRCDEGILPPCFTEEPKGAYEIKKFKGYGSFSEFLDVYGETPAEINMSDEDIALFLGKEGGKPPF